MYTYIHTTYMYSNNNNNTLSAGGRREEPGVAGAPGAIGGVAAPASLLGPAKRHSCTQVQESYS